MHNITLILVSVLFNSAAQIFIKRGMEAVGALGVVEILQHVDFLVRNVWLWLAALCYIVSIVIWLSVLSKVDVSFAYPFLSVGYIVVAIVGYLLFNESLTIWRILGIIVICIGVFLISRT